MGSQRVGHNFAPKQQQNVNAFALCNLSLSLIPRWGQHLQTAFKTYVSIFDKEAEGNSFLLGRVCFQPERKPLLTYPQISLASTGSHVQSQTHDCEVKTTFIHSLAGHKSLDLCQLLEALLAENRKGAVYSKKPYLPHLYFHYHHHCHTSSKSQSN